MYKPAGIVACIFILLLISTSGSTILYSTPKAAMRTEATGETSLFETPALPDQYTARGPQAASQNPVQAVVVTTKAQKPVLNSAEQREINGTGLTGGVDSSAANVTIKQVTDYLTLPQDYANTTLKSAEINFWNAVAKDIDQKIDGGNNVTVSFARLHVTHGGTYDSVGVYQVSDFWDFLMLPPPAGWTYINDPLNSDETFWDYLSSASDSINDGLKGDCDDFAILNAALVEAIGGNSRVVYAANANGAHMYAEAQFPLGMNVTPVIQARYNLSAPTIVYTHPGNWLNLDWFDYPATTTHPGGKFYDDGGMIWVIYKDGNWEKIAHSGSNWTVILKGPL
jgi:hypothetical protein